MKQNENIKEVLIDSSQVASRVAQLGAEISRDYAGKTPLMLCVLKGSVMFFADLVRSVDMDVNINFVTLSSYGSGTQSSGNVRMLSDVNFEVHNRDIIVVEDIVDSGYTMKFLSEKLKQSGAKSVAVCTLLSKPSRRMVDVDLAYVGFEIPDKFVVGYGMDFAENYRGLRDICVLKEEAYM